MKKLIALVAVLSYVPFAHAQEGNWTHSGEYRLQYFNNENDPSNTLSGGDTDQFARNRVKLNTTVRAGEQMTFNVGLVHNSIWGANPDQTPDSVGVAAAPGTADTSNLLLVNEFAMSWQASDELMFKVGRITQTLGDGTVVSSNDWYPVAKAFDGLGAMYDLEKVRLGAFAVAGARSTVANNNYGNFYGIVADWKDLPAFLKMAHFHYITVSRDQGSYAGVAVDKEATQRIGLTLAGDTAGIDYKGTYAMYSGETETAAGVSTDIDSMMMDFEVGYSMPALMNLRAHVGYHQDSGDSSAGGDNETYEPFHWDSYNRAGLMDVFGWGNLTYLNAGVALAPMEDLTVGVEYLMFSKTEKNDDAYNINHTAITNASTTAGEDDLGTELDLVVTKKYSNNFSIQGRYGMFTPGDSWGNNDDTFTQYYLESKLTF